MSKNVAVFVDVANIFYAAKAAGVDIDYVTLLKAGSAGRDLVRAYAYTGLDPDNENQRNFHEFLRRHGYKVVSKDIRKYGDGKVKANLDIELVVDMMKTARNLDIAIVVSGDGDFAPAIRAVQEMGVRVEVVSFRGNTSSDLIDVADQFTDITQIAKVEKGSSRSGRRVADDDADLSMTEVPDKMTEGTGESRRGRGRTRSRTGEASREPSREPVRAAAGRTRRAASSEPVVAEGALVALPGEKLSRVAAVAADRAEDDAEPLAASGTEAEMDEEVLEAAPSADGAQGAEGDEASRRRRRRRGGRGRGRGRREEGVAEVGAPREPIEAEEDEEFEEAVPRPPRVASTFGSVWDSQIGVPAASGRQPAAARASSFADDEDDLDEPPIPEYLIAERRQRNANAGPAHGGRGGRGGAYAAAMDRERFGGGRGSTPSRFAQPVPRRDGGPNRIDRNDRDRDRGGFRRDERPDTRPAPRPVSSDEPWSEVPPELEAMLRAQLAAGGGRSVGTGRPSPRPADRTEAARPASMTTAEAATNGTGAEVAETASAPARRTTRRATRPAEATEAGTAAPAAATRRRGTRSAAAMPSVDPGVAEAAASDVVAADPAAAPKRATTRRTSTRTPRTTAAGASAESTDAGASDTATAADVASPAAAPKRRTRKAAEPAS